MGAVTFEKARRWGRALPHLDNKDRTPIYCYHFDALGRTRALTDSSEVVKNTYEYDAYGNVLSKTENVTNPYQFVAAYGYYADPDTGLLYLRARYYSPISAGSSAWIATWGRRVIRCPCIGICIVQIVQHLAWIPVDIPH